MTFSHGSFLGGITGGCLVSAGRNGDGHAGPLPLEDHMQAPIRTILRANGERFYVTLRDASCLVPSFNGSQVGIVVRKLGPEVPDDLRRLESRDLHGFQQQLVREVRLFFEC